MNVKDEKMLKEKWFVLGPHGLCKERLSCLNKLLLLILTGLKVFQMCGTDKKNSRIKKTKMMRKKMSLEGHGEKEYECFH